MPPNSIHDILVLMMSLFESKRYTKIGSVFLTLYFVHFLFFYPFIPISHNVDLIWYLVPLFWNPIEIDDLSRATSLMCIATNYAALNYIHL
jgi:hypothetical protein